MSVSINSIESLNKKIDAIRQNRTKVEAQMEFLKKRLSSDLSKYTQEYGVNLKEQGLKATKEKVEAELSKVESEIQAEYNLKEKVVSCIEKGDIAEANKLLGITTEEEEEPQKEEPVEETSISLEDDSDEIAVAPVQAPQKPKKKPNGMFSVGDVFSGLDLSVEDDDLRLDESDDLNIGGDSDDDEDFGFGDMLKGSKFDI